MDKWRSFVQADPIDWLLEENDPSVRFYTLTDILGRDPQDREVEETRAQIMRVGIVPAILAKQKEGGYWETPEGFYRTKYKGTVWQIIILAELGASGDDEGIKSACEFILSRSQDPTTGGFCYRSDRTGKGEHQNVIPCLTGNMVWSLIKFGYRDDPRVQRGVEWITNYQRFDDGSPQAPKGWPYDGFERCWGRHTCHMAVVKALKALAEIPVEERTDDVMRTIESGAEHLLKHHLYKRSHDLRRVAKREWLQPWFPRMWKTDILEMLGILTKLGYRDQRMQDAVDLLVSKQNEHGQWILGNNFNGRFQVDIERKGEPSKWITLRALKVLKAFYSSTPPYSVSPSTV